jgi:hypothetical protein
MEGKGKKSRKAVPSLTGEPPAKSSSLVPDGSGDEWVARLTRLQETLTLCPADIAARGDLALLLERLGQHEEALFNWQAVLACDPNSLKAREGVARCRRRTGQPLQSNM